MRKLAPHIYRQRMVFEGFYGEPFTPDEDNLSIYMTALSEALGMTIVFGPKIMRLAEKVDPKHTGYEAVMIWAESGVNLYTWENGRFFTVDVYSCKHFDDKWTANFTATYFDCTEYDWESK